MVHQLPYFSSSSYANNAVVAFNRIDTYSYAGNIRGTGDVAVISGSLILSGANTYTGRTTSSTPAILIIGGKSQRIELKPADASKMVGTAPAPVKPAASRSGSARSAVRSSTPRAASSGTFPGLRTTPTT